VGVTELGQQLLKGAQPALAALAQTVEGINEARDKPAGLLRLNVARASAELLLYPHLRDFAEAFPDITLELVCDNRMVDLVEGGFDAGIRLGESLAQDVVALPVGGPQRMVTVASPRYLAERQLPKTPEDLREHQCMNYRLTTGGLYRWEYAQDGRVLDIEVAGPLISNDGDVLLAAARNGAGIAVAFEGSVRGDIENGGLVPLLEPWWPTFPGFYLYHPSSAQIPRKLRVFIDFLQARHEPPPVSQRAVKLASVPRSRPPSPARRAK
jgi:DNA-binding transcriptional LysR family regulator